MAAGLAVRLILASILFWVSYLGLPFLGSLQLGGGFWKMALDAQEYYRFGLHAAEQGILSVPVDAPSRTYVLALAAWMTITGTSPFSAVLLNLACYVGTCAVIVAVVRGIPDSRLVRASYPIIATISFSPMLLFVSTQALKDAFLILFAVLISTGVWRITSLLARPSHWSWRRLAPGMLALGIGIFMTAGVRAYFPVIAIACCGLALLASLAYGGRSWWRLTLGTGVLTLAVAAAALTLGSRQGRTYVALAAQANSPRQFFLMLQAARRGFQHSGGATNIAADEEDDDSLGDITGLSLGVATLVVPLTLLHALSIVHVTARPAMLALGDLDTVFFDITVVAIGLVTLRLWRGSEKNVPHLVFGLSFALGLAALMAYSVTNVGTLVRLRLMVLVPCWTLPFVFVRLRGDAGAGIGPERDGTLPR